MSEQMQNHVDRDDPEDKPEALRMCLQYLYREAMEADLRLTAHLIGAAAESIKCRCGNSEVAYDLTAFRGGTRQ